MIYHILADAVVCMHFSFVIFASLGGLIVLRYPIVRYIHIPAFLWAGWISFSGWICPLTLLEIWFRHQGGAIGYTGGFVRHYLEPILYPAGLTRTGQWFLGGFVVLMNLMIYGWLYKRRSKKESTYASEKEVDETIS